MTPTRVRKRPCWKCGTPATKATCPLHEIPPPTRQEAARRKAVVEQWIRDYGNVCPGHQVPMHDTAQWLLEADHITPRTQAGEQSPLQVLCKSCNSRKQDGWR